MRILITGGAGFIGSTLAIKLRQSIPEAQVVCMDNLYRRGSELNFLRLKAIGAQFYHGDVRQLADFPQQPFDVLVDCAAEPSAMAGQSVSPDYLIQTNLVGVYHCLEKARAWNAKFVFMSSSRIYPIAGLEAHPWKEEATRFVWDENGTSGIGARGVSEILDLCGARSLYGFTKLAGEQLIDEYRVSYGVPAIVNRCGVVAGPWQFGRSDQGVVALWVLAHYFRRPLQYYGYSGRGKQVRDFLHVDDLCELVCRQLLDFEEWEGWVGNVAGGFENSASLLELTNLCREVSGQITEITAHDLKRPNDIRILILNCERLFLKAGWKPQKTVQELVTDTYRWVDEHASALKSTFQ